MPGWSKDDEELLGLSMPPAAGVLPGCETDCIGVGSILPLAPAIGGGPPRHGVDKFLVGLLMRGVPTQLTAGPVPLLIALKTDMASTFLQAAIPEAQ
mmetsp:Transcript_102089/g.202669  ORF Transcript_102089/g.202669 Transcript_102089/m.202669 type:complete len:97 (-) Transcript_102089:26-316(-)